MAAAHASASSGRGIPRVPPAHSAPDPTVIASIDFGTYGSSFCFAFKQGTAATADGAAKADLNIGTPGNTAPGSSDKALTAILLDAATMETVMIGQNARKRYGELCDDGDESKYLYFEHFKMAMSPGVRPKDVAPIQVKVRGAGANLEKPLLLPVAKYLKAVREDAVERMRLAGGIVDRIGWVLTVPAIWDDLAKAFMRTAAVEAGMIDSAGSPNLMLALEPEGAAIQTMLAAPDDLKARFRVGECALIVDCGGGTVDCTCSEFRSITPLQIREVLPASGGPWGGRMVDESFFAFCGEVLGAAKFSGLEYGTRLKLLDSWETAKRRFGTVTAAGTPEEYRVEFADIEAATGGADACATAIKAYNQKKGYTADREMVTRTRRGMLVFYDNVMKKLYDPSVEKILTHVRKLLDDAVKVKKEVKFILLVGGYANSPYLIARIRERFAGMSVVVPEQPQMVVNRGATRFGLFPLAFVQSRVARYTYAISISESWNPRLHSGFEIRRIRTETGAEFCDFVLRPLVQKGESVPVDEPCLARGFKAVRRSQLEIGVRIYRIDGPVPAVSSTERRMVVVPDGLSIPGGVPESAKVAEVVLKVADSEATPLEDRVVDIAMYFGRAEIVVNATSQKSGESKYFTINFT